MPYRRLLHTAIHSEGVLNIFCVIEVKVGRMSDQEQIGELGVYLGGDVLLRQREEALYLVERED